MADVISKKLLKLLEPTASGPVRRAAVLVIGELGLKDKEFADALVGLLEDSDAELRTEAMRAASVLRLERALPALLARVNLGGPEADIAAQAAARLGAKGIKSLQELMGKVAPGLRRRVATALAGAGSTSAEIIALDNLLDADPGLVDAVTRTLIGETQTLAEAQRRALSERILELLKTKKGSPLPAHSEGALLRLLAALGDPRSEAAFWSRTEASYPPELRAEALQALGTLPLAANVNILRRLLVCVADSDFRVAAPALMLLKDVPVRNNLLPEWLGLLHAPDVAGRRFAIEKLADQDTPEFAAALLPQLKHPDKALREQALAALVKLKHGPPALAEQLLEAETPEDAWQLARFQARLARDYPAPLRTKLFNRACAFLEKEDRRADAFLFLLNEADAKDLRDRLTERAQAFRKKKQYPTALHYLRLLGRDPACGEASRFELAACGLKVSAKDVAPGARAADPCLQQFLRLLHSHDTHPYAYLEKANWLVPEELFYLGFHFVEGTGAERDFGEKVLRLVLKKSPRGKLATTAKTKLRSAGLS